MIDDSKVLRDFLLASSITVLTGSRIWAERDTPPPGYEPGLGNAICFKRRGGSELDESSAILGDSYQFKCYAGTEIAANALYRMLYDVLHEQRSSSILFAQVEVAGETLREQEDKSWIFVLTFFRVLVRNP